MDEQRRWDALYETPRFSPVYPEPEVVRFAMRNFLIPPAVGSRFIDVGAGAGRHTRFLADLGFVVAAVDLSLSGLRHARERVGHQTRHRWDLVQAAMTSLPFAEDTFAGGISWAAFYYGGAEAMKAAIAELHRVLKTGARALVAVRTTDDHRYTKGDAIETDTIRLTNNDTNEQGMTMHFVSETTVPEYFGRFARVDFERLETTVDGRTARNSDWIIVVQK
jgi:ubiquinone/menaquinone biosynthesis C-methylase UbiE